MSAGTLITCIVVTVAVHMARVGKRTGVIMTNQLEEMNRDISDKNIKMYDGLEVYGADVVNCMKHELGNYDASEDSGFEIQVITSNVPYISYTYKNSDYFDEIQDFTNNRYIPPLHRFEGKVVWNGNDVITKLIFTVK